jgi:integrase
MQLDSFTNQLWPKLNLAPRTIENYRGAYQRYVSPYLGHYELAKISKPMLISVLDTLPPQTQFQTLMALRNILKAAHDRELISENIAQSIKAPRIRVLPKKFLTWQELCQLDLGRQANRIKFLALHGLRWSEASALDQLDIVDGQIRISKSSNGATKTFNSERFVPYLGYFEKFPTTQKSIARALRVHGVTVHSLRKTYAYSLKSAEVHVTTAAKLMGHSNPMVTLRIYTAVLDEEIEKSGEALRKALNL